MWRKVTVLVPGAGVELLPTEDMHQCHGESVPIIHLPTWKVDDSVGSLIDARKTKGNELPAKSDGETRVSVVGDVCTDLLPMFHCTYQRSGRVRLHLSRSEIKKTAFLTKVCGPALADSVLLTHQHQRNTGECGVVVLFLHMSLQEQRGAFVGPGPPLRRIQQILTGQNA